MIDGPYIYHQGTDENGLFDPLTTYFEIDSTFLEREESEIRELQEKEKK